MKILVTAGNTQVPIDQVRCISNIFTGRTGATIAREAHSRGHSVHLLTSHPDTVADLEGKQPEWRMESYRTFDDLEKKIAASLGSQTFDAVIHSAAVSDYRIDRILAIPRGWKWIFTQPLPAFIGGAVPGKLKSNHRQVRLWLKPTPKLVDMIRDAWRFPGILVKFKLEVGVPDEKLLAIAEQSRQQSQADLMVANTLEGKDAWAYLGPLNGQYQKVERPTLASRLLDAVEDLHRHHTGG